jgi:hypothetical protein
MKISVTKKAMAKRNGSIENGGSINGGVSEARKSAKENIYLMSASMERRRNGGWRNQCEMAKNICENNDMKIVSMVAYQYHRK